MCKKIIKGQSGFSFLDNNKSPLISNLGTSQAWHQNQQNKPLTVNTLPQVNNIGESLANGSGLASMWQQNAKLSNTSRGSKLKNLFSGQNFAETGIGNFSEAYGGIASGVADTFTNMLQPKVNGDAAIQGVGNVLDGAMGAINPVAGMVNSGANLLNAGLGKAFGKSTDYSDKSGQIFDKATDALNMLGPIGMVANFALDFGNMLGSKKVKGVNISDTAKQMRGSYEGSISQGEGLKDKNFSGISRIGGSDKRYRRKVKDSQRKIDTIDRIGETAQDDFAASNNPLAYNRMQMSRSGGFQATAIGREGMKIFTQEQREFATRVISAQSKHKIENPVPEFKDGGKMNVIPEGELHARKHNMDIEGITSKGIPVVVEKADGGVVQQAEIEKNEIIFNLEVTKKLEKLMKEDTDEAAIEAGKLLVQEILHNTEDRTGLLNEVE